MEEKMQNLKQIINTSQDIVFFGGAGVSTESNIPDFRSQEGLYAKKYPVAPEIMLSHAFFIEQTEAFFDFYLNAMIYPSAEPNYAHIYLANLEKEKKLKAIITQNIDGLHQKAGSENVIEIHGSVNRNYCMNCGKFYDAAYMVAHKPVPKCMECGSVIKPDVVLYDEPLDQNVYQKALTYVKAADTLIVGGTSLAVYPAASLVDYFMGDNLIIINKTKTAQDSYASLVMNDSLAAVFKRLA